MEEKASLFRKLTEGLGVRFPESGEGGEAGRIEREALPRIAARLRASPLADTMLLDLTAVDRVARGSRFDVVYTFFSPSRGDRLRLTAEVPADDARIGSLTGLWKNAEWLEREVFDMFGLGFDGHPDLRRLLLYDGFEGHPLRKSYPLRRRQPRTTTAAAAQPGPFERKANVESMLLNMGPSHPAMHGTIRIMLALEGERVVESEVEVGYLHRGFEKTCEHRTYFNLLPYTDRLNYVSPLINNLGYAMTVERMLGLEVPERAQWIRVIMGELSRVADHLTCLAAMAMECGAFTVFLYNMKAREYLWEVIEATAGVRMTTSYVRVGGVRADLAPGWEEAVRKAVSETRRVLRDVSGLLDKNRIFLDRTRGVGTISTADALSYGWTGPCLRSTGLAYDVRKRFPYLTYDRLEFEVPVGEHGDNFDRYLVRMKEMEQSLRIIEQAAARIPASASEVSAPGLEPAEAVKRAKSRRPLESIALSPNLRGSEKAVYPGILAAAPGAVVPPKEDTYASIEGLITHFTFFMKGHGIRPLAGETYFSVEGGNGELGFYIVSDGSDRPYRLHLRAPCFHIVAALSSLIQGRYVADVIPTFGSMNMIGGELDR